MKASRALYALLPLTATLAFGQTASDSDPALAADSVVTTPAAIETAAETGAPGGETAVTLDVGFGIRAVLPSRVTVPVGEILRITAPNVGDNIQYIWTKNGRAIPGASERTLVINHVVSSDAGTYVCLLSTPATMPQSSQALILGVGPTDRLLNVSTRAVVTSDQGLVSGFVVAAGARPKKLIIRAIGPSLAMFGVTNGLRVPVLRVYDANGRLYENQYVYPAVVGGPTYETDLAESLAWTGAFPLPAETRDAVTMQPFNGGSYTVHVTSGDGSSGLVLLEVYEVP